MSAIMMSQIAVKDREKFQDYLAQSKAVAGKYGAELVFAGQYQQALSTLQSALSIDPQNPEGIYYMGRTELELGNSRQAAGHFEALLKKGYRGGQVHYFLAKSYGDQGDLGDAHFHMGLHQLQQRDLRKARAQLARALEETSKPQRRQEIEKLLKQIDEQLAAQKNKPQGRS